MKHFRIFLGILFALFSFATPVFAEEVIHTFDVKAELTYDRQLTITETIAYDFDGVERHGIFRFIPNVYDRDGAKYRLGITFLDATMDDQPIAWSVTGEGAMQQIKIGDADRYVTGKHVYKFTYRTNRAINDFADHRELYWNLTGNEWGVSIEQVRFTLAGPGESNQVKCFTGSYGDTAEECTIKTIGKNVTASSKRAFAGGEGMTVVIGYPLDAFRERTWMEKAMDFLKDNLWALTPFAVLVAMFFIWHRYGKEPKGRGTVVPEYEEPKGLSPGFMTGLLEQKVSQRAITATILDLARRGYMKIRFEDGKKYTFVKGAAPENIPAYESAIWNGLFATGDEVKMENLKGKFWTSVQDARTKVFDGLREKNLFGTNPSVVRALWIGIAFALFVGSFFLSSFFGDAFILSGMLSALIVALFGWQMPKMTKEGAATCEEIKGFKWFLSVTEKARLDFTDAPERKPDQFARFLPAAVAFGVESKWAGQFAGIAVQPPAYFEGTMTGWNAMQFANAVDALHASSVHSMYPAPSSAGHGGSGFSGGGSGGGFGGGGGGSW